jgi:cytochrome c553
MLKKVCFTACWALLMTSMPGMAADADAGKQKSQTCAACHGPDGNSVAADFPRLAGQYYDYLVRSIRAYQTGARKSPVMMPMVEKLTQRDIEDLAAYFSQQRGLSTPPQSPILRH